MMAAFVFTVCYADLGYRADMRRRLVHTEGQMGHARVKGTWYPAKFIRSSQIQPKKYWVSCDEMKPPVRIWIRPNDCQWNSRSMTSTITTRLYYDRTVPQHGGYDDRGFDRQCRILKEYFDMDVQTFKNFSEN